MQVIVDTPAKLNLSLEILNKRPDGFHELRSIFTAISLFDKISITTNSSTNEVSFACNNVENIGATENNLCVRAAKAYKEQFCIKDGLHINLEKNIPIGAGLGGGSSDAAAVLKGLDTLYQENTDSDSEALKNIAQTLGSDVPFFLFCGTALCEGRGEVLTEITPIKSTFLIVYPNISLSTAVIYERLHLTPKTGKNSIELLELLNKGLDHILINDLEGPAFSECEELKVIKGKLESIASTKRVLMSGSGSALFIHCENHKEGNHIKSEVERQFDFPTFLTTSNSYMNINTVDL